MRTGTAGAHAGKAGEMSQQPRTPGRLHRIGRQMTTVHHRYATTSERPRFYREAGPEDAAVLVLLHGFPTSSFMFRHLIPKLADRYRVIAPDHLGFGLSDAPP